MKNQVNDRIFIEKKERIRFLVEQPVIFEKLIEKLREKFKVKVLKDEEEIIVIVEMKEEEEKCYVK